MNIANAIRIVAEKNNISIEDATGIINSFYDDLYSIMRDRQGALILVKGLGLFHSLLKANAPVISHYINEIDCLIAVREGKFKNHFRSETYHVAKCLRIASRLGSIVISQIDYYYNVYGRQKNKAKRQVNVFLVAAAIRRLDYFIGAEFHEGFCQTPSKIQEEYMQRVQKQGLLLSFREEFEVYPDSEMQHLWLHPTLEDSIPQFRMSMEAMGKNK